jgi:ABC-type transport system involved in multi-copper enzyme maturation permease subunit
MITPVYLASAIAEEKERRTLEFLFTTSLLDREIVLGKLFGRVTHLVSLLLVGLPILFISQIWGGVDGMMLLGSFVVALLTLLSVASIGLLCSVLAPSVFGAILRSYVLVSVLGFVCLRVPACAAPLAMEDFNLQFNKEMSAWQAQVAAVNNGGVPPPTWTLPGSPPAGALALLRGRIVLAGGGVAVTPGSPGPPLLTPKVALPPVPNTTDLVLKMMKTPVQLHLGVFLFCTALSVFALRQMPKDLPSASFATPAEAAALGGWGPWEEPEVYVAREPYRPAVRHVPVRQPALLWKEVYHGRWLPDGPRLQYLSVRMWKQLALVLLVVVGVCLFLNRNIPEIMAAYTLTINAGIRFLTIGLAALWCVCLGFRTAGSMCRERAQNTLDGLLMLPIDRNEILHAKWLGTLLRWQVFGFALLAIWTAGLVTGALHAWAVLLMAVTCAVYIVFLVNLGMWLSLASASTRWANLTMAVILLGVFGGSSLRVAYTSYYLFGTWLQWPFGLLMTFLANGVNPAHTLWLFGFSWTEFADHILHTDILYWQNLSRSLAELILLSILAWALWRLACRRFRRDVEVCYGSVPRANPMLSVEGGWGPYEKA